MSIASPLLAFTAMAPPGSGVLVVLATGLLRAVRAAMAASFVILAAALGRHVQAPHRLLTWMRRTFAAAFGGLGAQLAPSER